MSNFDESQDTVSEMDTGKPETPGIPLLSLSPKMSKFDESEDTVSEMDIGKRETPGFGFKKRKHVRATKTINVDPSQFRDLVIKFTGLKEKDQSIKGQATKPSEGSGSAVVDNVNEDEYENLPEHLKWLLQYCLLFPSSYEFRKDKLVKLWVAEGYIRDSSFQSLEDTGRVYFNSLVAMGFILPSRYDNSVDFVHTSDDNFVFDRDDCNSLYRLNDAKMQCLEDSCFRGDYTRVANHGLHGVTDKTLHLSLNCKDTNEATLTSLENFKQLRTLLLLSSCGSSIKQVRRELFLSLKLLRTLDLSETLISELPSSIGNVKSLRYLDVSHTLIKRLPESVDCLHNLQTLNLKGCLNLVGLPKGMKKLINLRHLELDIVRQLVSMPAKIGNLTNLQNLSAFLVGRDDGFQIRELKNLNNLSGVLVISRLENVMSTEEAEDAALAEKRHLYELELRWSDMRIEKAEEEEENLECLRPHFGLKELRILCYGGLNLPSWISNPKFDLLIGITLYKCKNCQILPSLGVLPALKFLHISEMNDVKVINSQFLRNGSPQRLHAFPKLEKFAVDAMHNLEEWTGVEIGDFPSLRKLVMESCSKFVALPSLSNLSSLEHLEIKHCPKLHSLPEEGLSASLEFLLINDCPGLKERCSKEEGQDWGKIAHVTSIWIDHQKLL
ncbi:putative disease resistance RPP13-like protein 1 [Ziziphus jujuba]|uniref:Disease resistance RPP13-like protein 1 n=1 Tax=Ziziphus jujuba TaxID=326968 RepID=A0A6P3ZXG0_ZIZJJ|nr:putative disease resistance RPP13-like protein 1 [Ziziphus jujuba]